MEHAPGGRQGLGRASLTVRIYWYAPFDNAHEAALAEATVRSGDHLTFQSLVSHLGKALRSEIPGCEVRRNLPDTPGDDGGSRTLSRRAQVALSRARRRSKLVSAGTFDVVHLHTYNLFTDPVSLRRLRARTRRLVLSVHNVRPHDPRAFGRAVEARLLKAGYHVPSQLIVADTSLRTQLIDQFGVPASRIEVVPLPVISAKPPKVHPEGRTHLFFGTLRENKGLDVLLDAMALVPDHDLRLHIAGRGAARLEALARSAARADRRISAEIGYISVERQDELLRSATSVVLPYTALDAQSGVLCDAYSYRRPVIATSVGALGPEVERHRTGVVVPPNDPGALAGALVSVQAGTDRWQRFTTAAGAVADQRSIPAIGQRIRELYDLAPIS